MKVIIVGIFFAILAGILAEARAVDGNSTDVAVPNARKDSNVTLRNIHINLQPIERFLNWIFEEKIVSEVGEQSPRTFARIRWMGKMFNLVMFLLGMLITMSAGGIMMGMWSVKLGVGVMLLNMAVLLLRLLVSGGNGNTNNNNGGGGFSAAGGFMNGGGGNGGGGMMMLPQGRVNFQIFSSQSPVIATMPTMLMGMGNLNGNGMGVGTMGNLNGMGNLNNLGGLNAMTGSMIPIFGARLPVATIQAGTANGNNNDRVEFLGNLVGVAPLNQNWANMLNQGNRKKK